MRSTSVNVDTVANAFNRRTSRGKTRLDRHCLLHDREHSLSRTTRTLTLSTFTCSDDAPLRKRSRLKNGPPVTVANHRGDIDRPCPLPTRCHSQTRDERATWPAARDGSPRHPPHIAVLPIPTKPPPHNPPTSALSTERAQRPSLSTYAAQPRPPPIPPPPPQRPPLV